LKCVQACCLNSIGERWIVFIGVELAFWANTPGNIYEGAHWPVVFLELFGLLAVSDVKLSDPGILPAIKPGKPIDEILPGL